MGKNLSVFLFEGLGTNDTRELSTGFCVEASQLGFESVHSDFLEFVIVLKNHLNTKNLDNTVFHFHTENSLSSKSGDIPSFRP